MPQLLAYGLENRDRGDGHGSDYDPFVLKDVLWCSQTEDQQTDIKLWSQNDDQVFELPPLKLDASQDLLLPLELPPLDSDGVEQLENLDDSLSSISRSVSPVLEQIGLIVEDDEDFWILAAGPRPSEDETKFLSWESFVNPSHEEPIPPCITEAGDAAFDAALELFARDSGGSITAGTVVRSDALLIALQHMALARPSVLFPYSEDKTSFRQAIGDQRLSGYSFDSCQDLIQQVSHLGFMTLQLKSFRDHVYGSLQPVPCLVALASVVDAVTAAIEEHTINSSKEMQTPLQLKNILSPIQDIIGTVSRLVHAVTDSQSDEQALSKLFETAQTLEDSGHDRNFLCKILETAAQPWLDRIAAQLGLFKQLQPSSYIDNSDDHFQSSLASLIPAEDVELIQNIESCSQFLQSIPAQDISQGAIGHIIEQPPLELALTYDDMERIASKAQLYKDRIATALQNCDSELPQSPKASTWPVEPNTINSSTEQVGWYLDLEASITCLSNLPRNASAHGALHSVLKTNLSMKPREFGPNPQFSSIPHLSVHPFLAARSEVLTRLTLRAILLDNDLLSHLNLLQDFFLCGSGTFTSLLKTALFSPEIEPAERTKGTIRTGARSMGLRLESDKRREWPPASSELTLALMGVLNEACTLRKFKNPTDSLVSTSKPALSDRSSLGLPNSHHGAILPGGLSFAIRTNFTEPEIERAMNSQSVAALDFLRLIYTPSPSFSSIITPSSLQKYDKIFQSLLRMMRVQFVVDDSYREIMVKSHNLRSNAVRDFHLLHSMRHRVTYLVTSLSSYFHAAIQKYMAKFHAYILSAEHQVAQNVSEARNEWSFPTTLSQLASLHEHYLSIIMAAMLLRKREREAATLLEDLFDNILSFCRFIRGDNMTEKGPELHQMHGKFNNALLNFQNALRKLCDEMSLREPSIDESKMKKRHDLPPKILADDTADWVSDLRDLLSIVSI